MLNYSQPPQFRPGENVISIVSHPPEISPGTAATIVSSWIGCLCAVLLPNGEIHRWFAWFELQPIDTVEVGPISYLPGSRVTVVSNVGHGNPPHIPIGTMVRIVKCLPQTIFYDVMLTESGEYHRWLAEFELAAPIS